MCQKENMHVLEHFSDLALKAVWKRFNFSISSLAVQKQPIVAL
jgi:hypothetical protein